MGSHWVVDKYREAAKELYHPARQYWLNDAFLRGMQWIWYDPHTDTPKEAPDDGRLRYTINHMAPNHRTLVANATQRHMEFDITPTGKSDANHEAAALASDVIRATHDLHEWEQLRERLVSMTLKGGTAALCLDWDEQLQDTVERALTVADFVVEPGVQKAETARWWIKSQLLPPGEVRARYGLKDEPAADATNGKNPLQLSMMAAHVGVDDVVPLTQVLTYYERPNSDHPKGRVLTVMNGSMIEELEWPFPFVDHLNLYVAVETVVDNRWWGETIYSQARAPQILLNTSKSNLAEHLRDASQARMLVPHSAIQIMAMLDDVPGNMYPYPDGVQPPAWLDPAQLPAWLQGLPLDFKSDIDDIMGIHDVTRGRAPANLESGSALSILAEHDGSPVGRLTKEIARVFTAMARDALAVLEQMVTEERSAMVRSPYGSIAFDWTGKDLAGENMVSVPEDAVRPRSRAAMQQSAQLLVQMGLLKTPLEYVRFSEMPGQRDLIATVAPDVDKARRNIHRMIRGVPPVPAPFDNHETMVNEYNRFRLSEMYERMPREYQKIVDLAIQGHETMAAQALAKMRDRQQLDPAFNEMVPSANADPAPPPHEGMESPEMEQQEEQMEPDMEQMISGLPDQLMGELG